MKITGPFKMGDTSTDDFGVDNAAAQAIGDFFTMPGGGDSILSDKQQARIRDGEIPFSLLNKTTTVNGQQYPEFPTGFQAFTQDAQDVGTSAYAGFTEGFADDAQFISDAAQNVSDAAQNAAEWAAWLEQNWLYLAFGLAALVFIPPLLRKD